MTVAKTFRINIIFSNTFFPFKRTVFLNDMLDYSFEIEKELGKPIKEIFEFKGENFFRKFEEKITLRNLKSTPRVVSLGGGAFINKTIREEILKNHISFWLNCSNQILLNRIKKSKKRPLAYNLTKNELIDLMNKRSLIYSKALHEIKCGNLTKSEIVEKILNIYETH